MSFVSLEQFQQFDKNISEALKNEGTRLEAAMTELRVTATQQASLHGEMTAKMEELFRRTDNETKKTQYLEEQRADMVTKMSAIDQIKTIVEQGDTKYQQLNAQMNTSVMQIQEKIVQLNVDVAKASATPSSGGGGHKSTGILYPEVVKLDEFSGD